MELNEDQKKKIDVYFAEKLPVLACPLCHESDLRVNNRLLEIPEFTLGGSQGIAITWMPVLAVICANCSYTMFFSALGMGILETEEITSRVSRVRFRPKETEDE